jgi:hypothetical protein
MGRLSPAEVLERYFPDPGPMSPLLAKLDRLGQRPADRAEADSGLGEEILGTVEEIIGQGGDRLGTILYSLAQAHTPLLGPLLARFPLAEQEAGLALTQFSRDADDENYPMLDLQRQGLTAVPAGIELAEVPYANIGPDDEPEPYREINLGYNPITSLSEADAEALNHFQGIHLIGWKISSLPAEVRLLTNAVMINLSWTDITVLPPELLQLTRLRGLKLNWTEIASIPEEIAALQRLAFIEASETPFLELLWSAQAKEPGHLSDDEREALRISRILEEMGCGIEGLAWNHRRITGTRAGLHPHTDHAALRSIGIHRPRRVRRPYRPQCARVPWVRG